VIRPAWALILIILLVLLAPQAYAGGDPLASYTFSLEIDPESGLVVGDGEIALVNSSTRPLEQLPLILYPNRFLTQDPRVNDVNFERYYSYRFHPGDMKLVRLVGAGGVPCDFSVLDGMPSGTYVAVKLPEPVPPGKTARIGVRFETHVPDRFGLFGRRSGRLVTEGGLWPLIPARDRQGEFAPKLGPMRARHDITVQTTSGTAVVSPGKVARTVFVGAGPDMEPAYHKDAVPAFLAPEISIRAAKDDDRLGRIAGIVLMAAQVFQRDWIPVEKQDPIEVVIAPVRDRIAHAGGDAIFVSDRIFEVLPYLDSFHERELTRATFELMARRACQELEEGDAAWVSEAIGWVAIQEWDQKRLGLKGTDVREGLGTFDFIQFIDSQLRAPQFTDSDLYFGQVWEPRNNVRDELDRFGTVRSRGRVIAEKLRDKIGSARLKTLVTTIGIPFRERASKVAQDDLGDFFELWLGPAPREQLHIESREPATLPNGQEGVAITIRRDTDSPLLPKVGDPVTVQVDSAGESDRLVWDGKGDRGTLVFPRHGWWYSVQADPEGRIEEDYRGDDLYPSIGKLLLNRLSFSIDLNGGNTSSIDAGFTIHPHHDYHQSILIDAFYTLTAQGGRLGYAYHFGSSVTEIQFAQTGFVSVTAEHLEPGLLRFAGETLAESKGTLCAYTIGYAVDTREAAIHQTHGFHLGVALEAAHPWIGGDFTYQKGSANAIYIFCPFRPLSFAIAAGGGQVLGDNPPTQALFDVGGEDGVRGIRTGDFVDRAEFVAKGEVRVNVLEDLDVGVLKLFWLRSMELAAFTDAGDVKYNFGTVFRAPSQWKWGAGGGVRLEVDALGVRPFLLRFDIAWRCDSGTGPDRGKPQYYLGVNEPF
jgi:hypothetical protein